MGGVDIYFYYNMYMKIYTLSDPITKEIRYLGITKQSLNRRLSGHLYDTKSKKPTHKINWINSLLNNGYIPDIELLDEVDDDLAYIMEIYWISQLKSWEIHLTNSTLEGETPITKPGKDNPNYGNKYNPKNKTVKGRVIQLDFKGNFVREYICAKQTEIYGFSSATVGRCVNYQRTQHKGFQFIYKNDYNVNKDYKFIPKSTQRKTVEQIDPLTNKVINEFNSANEAEIYMGGKRHDKVARVCRGQRKTYKGFIWRYKIDNN